MLDDKLVEQLRRHWDEGWNTENLDVIMEPFAEDVVFNSPYVARATGDPGRTTVTGYGPLRRYLDDALRRSPGIRYTLTQTYVGPDSLVLVYLAHRPGAPDLHGADLMRIDAAGKVVEWRCHYVPA
jgi:hypothetical protein